MKNLRVAIIGFGSIGQYLYEKISADSALGVEITAICNRPSRRTANLPPSLWISDPADLDPTTVDLVVEAAHPDISRKHAERILRHASYMPLSLTALADDGLYERLVGTARDSKTTFFIPHGAAVGLDALAECRDAWNNVTVVMKKNPKNLDFAACPRIDPETIAGETVLYEGPTRGVCREFPRNVNAHAAVALAGIGFDRTRSVLIADPSLDVSVIELDARGEGIDLQVSRRNPLKGVSGIFTLRSALGAVLRARTARNEVEIC